MATYDLPQLFKAYADELRAALLATRGILWHPGQKGGIVEARFRELLRKILPNRLGVTEGVIYATNGDRSGQCDIIIYDQHHSPVIFNENGTRAIPIECAYAMIEAKSVLTAQAVKDGAENARKIKGLPKTAYHPTAAIEKSFLLTDPALPYYPTLYYIFSVEAQSWTGISAAFKAHFDPTNPALAVNLVYSLNDGVLCYRGPKQPGIPDEGLHSFPNSGSKPVSYVKEDNGLLAMGLLLDLLLAAEMYRDFNFVGYLSSHKFIVDNL